MSYSDDGWGTDGDMSDAESRKEVESKEPEKSFNETQVPNTRASLKKLSLPDILENSEVSGDEVDSKINQEIPIAIKQDDSKSEAEETTELKVDDQKILQAMNIYQKRKEIKLPPMANRIPADSVSTKEDQGIKTKEKPSIVVEHEKNVGASVISPTETPFGTVQWCPEGSQFSKELDRFGKPVSHETGFSPIQKSTFGQSGGKTRNDMKAHDSWGILSESENEPMEKDEKDDGKRSNEEMQQQKSVGFGQTTSSGPVRALGNVKTEQNTVQEDNTNKLKPTGFGGVSLKENTNGEQVSNITKKTCSSGYAKPSKVATNYDSDSKYSSSLQSVDVSESLSDLEEQHKSDTNQSKQGSCLETIEKSVSSRISIRGSNSTFGNDETENPKITGFGGGSSVSKTTSNVEPKNSLSVGFGNANNFGSNIKKEEKCEVTTGFGGNTTSTFGNGGKSENKSQPLGFGNRNTESKFGNDAKDAGNNKIAGFGNQSVGFGNRNAPSTFGNDDKKENKSEPLKFGDRVSSKFGDNSTSSFPKTGTTLTFGNKEKDENKSQPLNSGSQNPTSSFGSNAKNADNGVAIGFGNQSVGFGNRTSTFANDDKKENKSEPLKFGEPKSSSFTSKGFGNSSTSLFSNTGTTPMFGNSGKNEHNSQSVGFGARKPATPFGSDAKNSGNGEGAGFGGLKSTPKFGSGGFGGNSNDSFSKIGTDEVDNKGKPNFGEFPSKLSSGFGSSNFGREKGVKFGEVTEHNYSAENRTGSFKCHNCNEEGHSSRDCQKERSCNSCGETGHIRSNCPNRTPLKCYNCQQLGHGAKECENEKVEVLPTELCPWCKEGYHWSKDCPMRIDPDGNLIVPYDKPFKTDEELFEDVVEPKNIIFSDEYTVSMGGNVMNDMESFEEFKNLSPLLMDNLTRMKFSRPTAIQQASFFPILSAKDFVACAHTGCGKTLAFLLPLVTALIGEKIEEVSNVETAMPRCLIIAPTRELANQTYITARQLTYKTGIDVGTVYGGTSRSGNLQNLKSLKKLGILVATMGRLKDFIASNDISLEKVKYIVLDEADRMVNLEDFGEEVVELIGQPSERTAQLILFSASFSEELQRTNMKELVKENYVLIQVDKFGTANRKIQQCVLNVGRADKREKLMEILGIDPLLNVVKEDARVSKEKTLIFVNSIKFSTTLASFLRSSGVTATTMNSQFGQGQREQILESFRKGEFQVLVASNVCARGLNISSLNHVINYDLPPLDQFDEYVNRIGRTGRAGFDGDSTAFFCEESDSDVANILIEIMEEAGKEVPEWLTEKKAPPPGEEEEEEGW